MSIPQRNRGVPNQEAAHIVEKLVTNRAEDLYKPHRPYVAKPEAEVAPIVEAEATKQADEIRTAFVHKNYRKIASIIDAKGNYASGQEVAHSVSLGGLRGSFVFKFTDGSQFEVTNQVV